MGGSLNLEILRGGGLKQFWKSRWEGGSKNRAFHRGGVDFSGITHYFKLTSYYLNVMHDIIGINLNYDIILS